jgi:hypothetical protein
LAAGVAVAGAASVDVEVDVDVDVVVVVIVSVVAVLVAAVPVSSTTAGACAAGAVSGAAASFFWQPVARARTVAAANPRVKNFFINLFSFFLRKKTRSPRERKTDAPGENRRGMLSEAGALSRSKTRAPVVYRRGGLARLFLR